MRNEVFTLVAISLCASTAARAEAPAPLAATTVTLPSGPASVRGLADAASLDVFHGQVEFGVPLALPSDGRLAPGLSIAYAGALGNGPLGAGWTLGVPAIRRSLRQGVPEYTGADELEIEGVGGGRLIVVGDDEYRVEGSPLTPIVRRIGARFEVTDAAGKRWYFGVTAAARQEDGDHVAAWFVEEVVDLRGDRVSYAYVRDRGQVYLQRVTWGPDEVFSVDLDYETRPDEVASYRAGFRVVTAWRLARATVRWNGEPSDPETLACYHLAYDDDHPLSRLVEIRMTGRGDVGELPPVSFGYVTPGASTVTSLGGAGAWVLGDRGVVFADVDGDGMDDLLRLEMGNHAWRRNLGGTFGAAEALEGASAVEMETSRLIDLDGDARAELVRVVSDEWRAYRMSPAGWESLGAWPGTWGVPLGGDGVALADLDGDDRTDVVEALTDGIRVRFGAAGELGPGITMPPISSADPLVEPGGADVRFLDVNGDGLADVVWLTDAWMKVWFGRGDGTFELFDRVFYPWGVDFFEPDDVHLADLDRDGLVDLTRMVGSHVMWYRGLGNHRFDLVPRNVSRPESIVADAAVTIGDADGDGAADLVWSSPRGTWQLDLSGGPGTGLLASIDNRLGRTTRFEYQASALLAAEAGAAGDPWTRTPPVSLPVPILVEQVFADGTPTRAVHHTVRDGFWDPEERRFGGFLVARNALAGDTPAAARVEETRFHVGTGEQRVLRGSAWYARVEDGTGAVATVSESDWDALEVGFAHPLLRRAVVRERRGFSFEGVDVPIQTRVRYEYDAEGRVVEARDDGRLDLTGDEQISQTQYVTPGVHGVRDLVCVQTLRDGAGAIVSQSRVIYGDETGEAPLCSAAKGWTVAAEGRLVEPTGERWVRSEEHQYDAHGNVVETVAAGVRRTFDREPRGLFVIAEHVETGPGEELVWQVAWDEPTGQPTRLTEPTGDFTDMTYDTLGRVTALSRDGAPPHIRHEYDWTGPRPRTTVYIFDGDIATLPALAGAWTAGAPWRQSVSVSNSAGEELYSATRLGSSRWIISGWPVRDNRGRVVRMLQPFYWDDAALPAAPPPTAATATDVTYDFLDRTVAQVVPTGAATRHAYRAYEHTESVDGLAPVTWRTDGQGQVLHTERTVSGVVERADAVYDTAGRMTLLRLQGGAVDHHFTYDSLGRLTDADDPDIGPRRWIWDDHGRLLRQENGVGQSIDLTYDGAGRLIRRERSDGPVYEWHRDAAGRLVSIIEPEGQVILRYDSWGRASGTTRTVADVSAARDSIQAASGLLLRETHDDDFVVDYSYDRAGRLTAIGDLWQADDITPDGAVVSESYGNGVTRTMELDPLRLPRAIAVGRPGGTLYFVELTRNAYGAVTQVLDRETSGLKHNASFGYDAGGRLTSATIGEGGVQWSFSHTYDGLQNMTARIVSGPAELPLLSGTYRYGEGGAGPRQLTSVGFGSGPPSFKPDGVLPYTSVATFQYDAAGRQIDDGTYTTTWGADDELLSVTPHAGGPPLVAYGYGQDGLRTIVRRDGGAIERWFDDDVHEHDGVRDHYLSVGDRLVARVSRRNSEMLELPPEDDPIGPPGGGGGGEANLFWFFWGSIILSLLGGALQSVRRRRPSSFIATLCICALLTSPACFWPGSKRQASWSTSETVYLHQGFGPGPTLITRSDGTILEERRAEPFGAAIDSFSEPGGAVAGADYTAEPHNSLNKPSDPATLWSYHGARWMAPQSGRWISPDPPLKAADPGRVAAPWRTNPYQYGLQNPVIYWDPDGKEEDDVYSDRQAASDYMLDVCLNDELLDYYWERWTGTADPSPRQVGKVVRKVENVVQRARAKQRSRPAMRMPNPASQGDITEERRQALIAAPMRRLNAIRSGPIGGWLQYIVYERTGDEVASANAGELGSTFDTILGSLASKGPSSLSEQGGSVQKPTEAYNRLKHYGRTPTKADRTALGAQPGQVVDHDPPLVQRYYDGDPSVGEKPGYLMTPAERRASANDRSRMRLQPKTESNRQGRQMQEYSKQKKAEHGL